MGVRDRKLAYMNHAAEALFHEAAVGQPVSVLFPPDILETNSTEFLAACMAAGKAVTVAASRLRDYWILRILPDMESEAGQNERIFAGMGNQMRDALSVLGMAAELLSPAVEQMEQPKLSRHMAMIQHSYYRLMRLSENLSGYHKLSRGADRLTPRNVDVVQLCNQLLSDLRLFVKDVELRFEAEAESLIGEVDVKKLEQLLLAILSNSLKYTEAGGQVTLSVRTKRDKLLLVIRDTGRGIPEEVLPTVFQMFASEQNFTDIYAGIGLGLGIAKWIAAIHGGTILLESEEGSGTCVTVSLPRRQTDMGGFQQEPAEYRSKGMRQILTQLADVLTYEAYQTLYMD